MRDVCFSCDNNGAKFLCVTVWSLLEHYKGKEPLRINVFTGFGGHSEENRAKLQSIVGGFGGFSLRYHDVEPYVKPYADLIMNREKSRWNVFTWTPIFTPAILSDAEGNVAHFDIDMLFNDDVSKILDLDLGDNLIAAVAEYGKGDPVITEAVWGKGILPPEAERYFNTGTIVFNTAKCREERTWEKILAWYREHYDIADRIEQDAWNALYWRRTKLLPLRWNFHDRLIKGYTKRDVLERFWQGNHPVDCMEAALNPAILHFWGPKKPWKVSHRPYRKLYHAAMRAVGQVPPRESLLAFYHDWMTTRRLKRIRQTHQIMIGRSRPRSLLKSLKRIVLLPFEWLGIGLGVLVLSNLPHRALNSACDFISWFMYCFDRHGRVLSLENLRIVRGLRPMDDTHPVRFDPEKGVYDPTVRERLIIRRAYRNMARTIGHIFWTIRNAHQRVAAVCEIDAALREQLNRYHPSITLTAHIGCWEVLSQSAWLEGLPVMSVAKDIGTSAMTRLLIRARMSIGQEIVPVHGATKALLGGIRKGKTLGLVVDQTVSPQLGGVWVRFFGRPFSATAAPALLATRAGIPIFIAWSRPLKDGTYRCEYRGEVQTAKDKYLRMTVQEYMWEIEKLIRRHPSCWAMNYDFFKFYPSKKDLAALCACESKESRA